MATVMNLTCIGSRVELKLPTELAITVMELLWNRDWTQQVHLSRCSRVCSEWRHIAQKMLFTEVVLSSLSQAHLFLSSLQSNTSLGEATKTLQIFHTSITNSNDSERGLFKNITALCPNLYHIILGISSRFNPRMFEGLFHPRTFAKLQALTLTLHYSPLSPGHESWVGQIGCMFSLVDVLRFLHRFSSLSALRLNDFFILHENQEHSSRTPRFPPPSFALQEFGWSNSSYDTMSSNADLFRIIVDSIFGQASDTLRFFKSSEILPDDEEVIWEFLHRHGKGLRSLSTSIPETKLATLEPALSVVCPNLHELRLRYVAVLQSETRASLPTTQLEHLALTISSQLNEEELKELVKWVSSLPRIQCITLLAGRHLQMFPNSPQMLTWRSVSPNIYLNVIQHLADFPYDDPVLTTRFPRSRTLQNLARMSIASSLQS